MEAHFFIASTISNNVNNLHATYDQDCSWPTTHIYNLYTNTTT